MAARTGRCGSGDPQCLPVPPGREAGLFPWLQGWSLGRHAADGEWGGIMFSEEQLSGGGKKCGVLVESASFDVYVIYFLLFFLTIKLFLFDKEGKLQYIYIDI